MNNYLQQLENDFSKIFYSNSFSSLNINSCYTDWLLNRYRIGSVQKKFNVFIMTYFNIESLLLSDNKRLIGDLLAVTKLDRCSRNTLSFLQLKNQLAEKGVAFWVLDLPRDYLENSPSSQLISTALAAIAEFETARRKERQRQGIEAAKKKKKYRGRKSVITKDLIKTVKKYKNLEVSVTEIARITGKSRSTIYKVLKEELGYVPNRLIKPEEVHESN